MKKVFLPRNAFRIILWLIAVHSFLVGMGMILIPSSFIEYLGFAANNDCFFRYQGGVFHIVMSIAYAGAAINIGRDNSLVFLTIAAKFMATVFLFSYYFFAAQIVIIFLSGIGDFLMGIIVSVLFVRYKKLFDVNVN